MCAAGGGDWVATREPAGREPHAHNTLLSVHAWASDHCPHGYRTRRLRAAPPQLQTWPWRRCQLEIGLLGTAFCSYISCPFYALSCRAPLSSPSYRTWTTTARAALGTAFCLYITYDLHGRVYYFYAILRCTLAHASQDVDYDGEGSLWTFLEDLTGVMLRCGMAVVGGACVLRAQCVY